MSEGGSEEDDWIDIVGDREIGELATSPSSFNWRVLEPALDNTYLTINRAAEISWGKGKDEIEHILQVLPTLAQKDSIDEVTKQDIINFFFGEWSNFAIALRTCLRTDHQGMCKFMDYWCVQGLMKRDSKNIGN